MKVISDKNGDNLSQFEKFYENDVPILSRITDLPHQISSTSHQKMLIDNHFDANKSKIKGYLDIEDIFEFCKRFNKVT